MFFESIPNICRKENRSIGFALFIFFCSAFVTDKALSTSNRFDPTSCLESDLNALTFVLYKKINLHKSVELLPLSKRNRCKQLKKINKFKPNKLLITTTRKSSRYQICATDSRKKPCMVRLAIFNSDVIPSIELERIFNYKKPSYMILNETSERLFISPYESLRGEYGDLSISYSEYIKKGKSLKN